ncbi:MAG TPA: HAMP domain-containing sensor histidine kinase [Gemmatimonadaceae bacterium]|nr:HAMP domain-containing sensor histidine kinase [Gemmatimonadaceae bacterium]
MSFRARLLVALLLVAVVPLVVLALGVRREMTQRLGAEYERRVRSLTRVVEQDLAEERALLSMRLRALAEGMGDDNRLRAALHGADDERAYLLDHASGAMRLAGLSVLQVQDEEGRIISSGHFRQEYDRLEPELPRRIAETPDGSAVIRARTPDGPLLALATVDSVRIGARALVLVGGIALEERLLQRLSRDEAVRIALEVPDADTAAEFATADVMTDTLQLPFAGATRLDTARLVIAHPVAELVALRRSVDRWFLAAALLVALAAIASAAWLAARLGAPLATLARTAETLDLDRLDAHFRTDRDDEVGLLARTLESMMSRLRASVARLREAERRVAVGELARQVNHDIKNGLAPIRHVLRHLSQVAREQPAELPGVWLERQGTIEQSVAYLETLAANYAKLSPRGDRRPCDVNAIVADVARAARERAGAGAEVRTSLAPSLPVVLADDVVLRRILENLVGNAVESLEDKPGEVSVETTPVARAGAPPVVHIVVADTGKGMTERELARAFDDFYTTKSSGTGLGLSIVRRLVVDLEGTLRVETGPGTGTRFTIELPAAAERAARPSPRAAESVA